MLQNNSKGYKLVKKLEINRVYFYQGNAGCLFVRPIKPCGDRLLTITGIDANVLSNIEILNNASEYEVYRDKGDIMGIWTIKEEYLLKSILIPYDELPHGRVRKLDKRKIPTGMIIPIGMNKQEELSFWRESLINDIIND